MVRIAEVSGQNPEREQRPPAGGPRKRSAAPRPAASNPVDPDEPLDGDRADASRDASEPTTESPEPPKAATIDLVA